MTASAEHHQQPPDLVAQEIGRLRSEMVWSDRELLARNAYCLARQIGDDRLSQPDLNPSGEISELLFATRFSSRPEELKVAADSGSYHSERTGQLVIDKASFIDDSYLAQHAAEAGVAIKNPADTQVMMLIRTTAHEGAHALLAGVSRLYKSPRGIEDGTLTATKLYLRDHPEVAYTGNLNSDAYIREEQFAEGYAGMVMDTVVHALGYTDEEKQVLLEGMRVSPDLSGVQGANQLDHLDGVSATRAPEALVNTEQSSEAQQYPGELGYAVPLTPEEVADQLNALSTTLASGVTTAHVINPEQWSTSVKERQSPSVKAHLQELRERRDDVLRTQTAANLGATVVGGVAEIQAPPAEPDEKLTPQEASIIANSLNKIEGVRSQRMPANGRAIQEFKFAALKYLDTLFPSFPDTSQAAGFLRLVQGGMANSDQRVAIVKKLREQSTFREAELQAVIHAFKAIDTVQAQAPVEKQAPAICDRLNAIMRAYIDQGQNKSVLPLLAAIGYGSTAESRQLSAPYTARIRPYLTR